MHCIERGLIYVTQLFDERQFIGFVELNNNYGLTWWQYVSLRHAIPDAWTRHCIAGLATEATKCTLYNQVLQRKRKAPYLYDVICCSDKKPIEDLLTKVRAKLIISMDELCQAFRSIYTLTNITKYRDFQYRVLALAIHGNDRLFHWRVSDTQACEWCENPKQNMFHLLFTCPKVVRYWERVFYFCKHYLYNQAEIDTSIKALYLNEVTNPKGHLVNFIVLVAKQHLYACKCRQEPIHFRTMLKKLNSLYTSEKYTAIANGNLLRHKTKWKPYLNPLVAQL